MATPNTSKCELPSEKHYNTLDSVEIKKSSENFCNIEEILNKYPDIKNFCMKFASNLEILKEKEKKKEEESFDIEKLCTYLKLWLNDYVINTVENKLVTTYITLLYKVLIQFNETNHLSNVNGCSPSIIFVSIDHFQKWKKMQDYNNNYKVLKGAFSNNEECMEDCTEACEDECEKICKDDCMENYCMYMLDITNVYKEFEYVCTKTTNQKCPDFWGNFKENYSSTSYIETICKEVYENLGYYKVKVSFGEQGEESYVEQYEATYMFSFFEKLIGYSIKKILFKSLHYSKYIVLPIVLILLFYFFMKKLSFFGSKIAPKADDMRKMWRNVQGVTNPATLLNPMKPPGGGNKMGLPYMSK
ncbi:PIR Superfamily Protein [Plasmodium ovale curtisi]|uniref:PIR Superfamily Protein n=1 Tax=Plasmodium ovale curtisi TaxID=864141 RepID=A0A1A8WR26_PLAOA|nr:PIR Superfamily Protein [Plasmodium ovale curtisi]